MCVGIPPSCTMMATRSSKTSMSGIRLGSAVVVWLMIDPGVMSPVGILYLCRHDDVS